MVLTDDIKNIVRNALAEDIGSGDVTSVPIIPPSTHLTGQFLVKAPGVIAGLAVVGEVFAQVDRAIVYTPLVAEGSVVAPGDVVARVEGDGPGILIGERTAWGQGYGLDAWSSLLGWLLTERGLRKVTAGTLDCNAPMLRLMEKSGMHTEGARRRQEIVKGAEHDILYFARFRDD